MTHDKDNVRHICRAAPGGAPLHLAPARAVAEGSISSRFSVLVVGAECELCATTPIQTTEPGTCTLSIRPQAGALISRPASSSCSPTPAPTPQPS